MIPNENSIQGNDSHIQSDNLQKPNNLMMTLKSGRDGQLVHHGVWPSASNIEHLDTQGGYYAGADPGKILTSAKIGQSD